MKQFMLKGLLWLLFAACHAHGFAQDSRIISGVITDDNGKPVPSATVIIQGTKNAVATDESGRYSISTNKKSAVLVVSSVGYASKELPVGPQNKINASLTSLSGNLEGVVVTSLGISRKQKALGYGVSTISADQVTKAGTPNFATALYGKAAGVQIAASPGGATSAVNITVRGLNSITGKNQALIVLDGIPIHDGEVSNNNYWGDQRIRGNGLLDINPEDIETITILKGASAAALYGSDAVNGVVLITTKKGKGAKGFAVDVSANASIDKVAYLPTFQHVRGPGAQPNVIGDAQAPDGFSYSTINGQQVRGVLDRSINFGPLFDGRPTLSWDGNMRPYIAQNNYKNFFQDAHNSNITAALSHSSEAADMRFSITHQQTEGLSLGSSNNKNVANLNASFRPGKKFTTDVTVNYINQHIKNRPYATDRLINNFTGMLSTFDNPDWYRARYKTSMGYKYVTGTNQSLTPSENIIYKGFRSDIADFFWNVFENRTDEYSNRVIASLTNTWQIVNGLRLRARVATDFTSQREEDRNTSDKPLLYDHTGYFGLKSNQYTILYGDAMLTYNKKITSSLDVNLMAGYTANKENGSYTTVGTNGGLSTENNFDLTASYNKADASLTRTALVKDAFFGTINTSYKNYLFAEATLRRDRTSTLNPGNNSFYYPSVNASLILSDAFKLPSYVSYAKLRGSWGVVGNYTDPYLASVAYTQGSLGAQQTGGGSVIYTTMSSSYGNENLRPEEKHEFEFGIEAKFLKSRLGLEVSYYNARIIDQILPLTLPTTSGAGSILTNIGTLRNSGLEVSLTGTPVALKSFTWDTRINFATNQNKVEKLANNSTELIHADYDGNAAVLKSVVGQPMGDFYAHPVARNSKGEMIVGDDGLYTLDANLTKVGNAMPKVIGGIGNTFSYKGFSLDVFADFRYGGYVMPTGINWMTSRGLTEESLNYMDKAHGGITYYVDANGKGVQTAGTAGPAGQKVYNDGMLLSGATPDGKTNTNIVSQQYYYWNVYNWGGPQYGLSRYELYIVKNSYIKLRELTLSYNLPSRVVQKIGAKKLQFSVYGRNLLYFYRTIKNMDPEQLTAGSRWAQTLSNAGTNPSSRTIGIMLRAGF